MKTQKEKALELIQKGGIYKYKGHLRFRRLLDLEDNECRWIGERTELIYELAPEDTPRANPFGLSATSSPPCWEP